MNLQEILEHRRAVRYYDASKPIDADRVKECVRLATLAPTSSNMQLWEAYHVTDRATIDRLVPACMGQSAVKTAQQLVVFVVRPDLWKAHAKACWPPTRRMSARPSRKRSGKSMPVCNERIIESLFLSSILAVSAFGDCVAR